MRPATLRRLLLAFPGAVEEFPFDPELSTFKVGGRIFAFSWMKEAPLSVAVKCEPWLAAEHRASWPDVVIPAPYLGSKGWNRLLADGSLPDRLLRDMIEDSYDLVRAGLPRRLRPGG